MLLTSTHKITGRGTRCACAEGLVFILGLFASIMVMYIYTLHSLIYLDQQTFNFVSLAVNSLSVRLGLVAWFVSVPGNFTKNYNFILKHTNAFALFLYLLYSG